MIIFSFDVRNPLEVSEEFIQHFNNAETFEEKERHEEMARKMLERAKVSVSVCLLLKAKTKTELKKL